MANYAIHWRSWKNHLRSVKDENKIQIYQALGVLLQETSLEVFTDLLDKFQCHWEEREPEFITYFKEHYAGRPGIQLFLKPLHEYITIETTEKWAKSYRHFNHSDTDTNMFLERYVYNIMHLPCVQVS